MRIFLETDRLRLRQFTAADAGLLTELDGDPAVMRFLTGGEPTPRSVIEHDVLPRVLGDYERAAPERWAAIEHATGAFLGWFALGRSTAEDELELGYRLSSR